MFWLYDRDRRWRLHKTGMQIFNKKNDKYQLGITRKYKWIIDVIVTSWKSIRNITDDIKHLEYFIIIVMIKMIP